MLKNGIRVSEKMKCIALSSFNSAKILANIYSVLELHRKRKCWWVRSRRKRLTTVVNIIACRWSQTKRLVRMTRRCSRILLPQPPSTTEPFRLH